MYCKNCKYWEQDTDRYSEVFGHIKYNPITLDDLTEAQRKELFPYEVRRCKCPKVIFYEYPQKDGVALMDGSEYCASMATGPNYGCVNFEIQ